MSPTIASELADRRARGALRMGYCVPAFAMPGPDLFRVPNLERLEEFDPIANAVAAEAMGFDSLWVCDHLMLGRDRAVHEGWTMLAMIAGATRRAQIGLIHQAILFRPPQIAAKMMATIDRLSGGRFIAFLEAGLGRGEQVAYGTPWSDDHGARVTRLEEGIGAIAALFAAGGPIDYQSPSVTLTQAELAPKPLQAKLPLWFGEAFPNVLDLTARIGDGWNTTPVTLAELDTRLAALDAALVRHGRDRSGIEISFETQILVAPDRDGLRRKIAHMLEISARTGGAPPQADLLAFVTGETELLPERLTGPFIIGTPDEVVLRIAQLQERGVDHLMLWFMDAPDLDGMELFARQIAPHFR